MDDECKWIVWINEWINEWRKWWWKWNETNCGLLFHFSICVCVQFFMFGLIFFSREFCFRYSDPCGWKRAAKKKLWCYVLVCSIYVFLLMEHVGTWRVFFSLTLIHQWATFAYTTWLNNVLRPNIWKKRYGKTKGSLIFYVLCLCVSGSNSFICIQRIGVDWRPNTQMPS